MSDTETTRVWEEDEEIQVEEGQDDFSSALQALGEHLEENYTPEAEDLALDMETSAATGADLGALADEVALPPADDLDAFPTFEEEIEEPVMNLDVDSETLHFEASADVAAAMPEEDGEMLHFEEEIPEPEPMAMAEPEPMPEPEPMMMAEPEPMPEPEPAPMMAAPAGDPDSGMEAFNLATLTNLISDIRSESERVSQMKDSVSRALDLIQEMSEALKS